MKVCIIGLGYFGKNLALTLSRARQEVLAVDVDAEKVEAVKDEVSHAVILDASSAEALGKLPLDEMDVVVVAIGENFRASLLAVGWLQEMKVKRIIARVIDPIHERLLKLMRITELVHPEAESARRMAQALVRGVINSLDLTGGFLIVEARVPDHVVGKTLQQVGLRKEYQLNLVTVRKGADPARQIVERKNAFEIIGVPPADYRFEADDLLVLFGQEDHIDRFLRH